MNRLYILAASAVLVGGYLFSTTQTASAQSASSLVLVGQVDGIETDGAFKANVTFKDPVSDAIVYEGETLVDITNGSYKAAFPEFKGNGESLYKVEMEGLEAAEDFEMAGFVNLQDSTPGSVQTGHINISGYVLANRIGLGVSPTIAKVQVNETGSAQGVRSITNTGTAVYGQATAGTGLAAGGYFTTSSVGGRAMVGDALSTTGSTVGGLFYNRSQAGVAIWGRHINGAGDSIGVFGQTGSPTGTGVLAENTSTGDRASLAGANGSLYTQGTLPKHEYTTGTASTMVPIAYGIVQGTTVFSGSGNFTTEDTATGVTEITINGFTASFSNSVLVATSYVGGGAILCQAEASGGKWIVRSYDSSGNLGSSALHFVVFGQIGYNPPQPPTELKEKYNGDLVAWKRGNPEGFARFVAESNKAERNFKRVSETRVPYDSAEPAGQLVKPVIRPKK